MAIPTVAVVTTNLDADTDSPASARVDLLDLVQKFNALIAEISTTPAAGDIPIVNSSSQLAVTATSAVNADKTDNYHASATPTASTIPVSAANGKLANTWLNTGSGNGLDADKLDGVEGSAYARLASPALTGTPTAPTAAVGTNTTQLATTAFVAAALGSTGYSHAATGYEKLPSGFEMKWGSVTVTTTGSVTFATPFATACLLVIPTPTNAAAVAATTTYAAYPSGLHTTSLGTPYVSASSTTGFTLTSATSASKTFKYLAIGY